jgi:formylglycine-generating enzyme required for sulfatase activity
VSRATFPELGDRRRNTLKGEFMQETDNAAVRVQIFAAPANAAFAEKAAHALAAEGYVIAAGEFDPKEVDAAIIIWSGASIASPEMVKAAALPLACNALIPVSIGMIEAPPAFRHLDPVDLAGWTGDAHDPRWRFVIDEIDRAAYNARLPPGAPLLHAPPPPPSRDFSEERRGATRTMLLASFGIMSVVVLGGFIMLAVTRNDRQVAPPLIAATQTAPESAPQIKEPAPAQAPSIGLATPEAPEGIEAAANEAAESATNAAEPPQTPAAEPSSDKLAALIAESVGEEAGGQTDAPITEETTKLEIPPETAASPRAPGEVFRDCPACPEMAITPAGSFSFGSAPGEPLRQSFEGPVTTVEIAKPFAIGAREITFAEWDACVADGGCKADAANDVGWGRGKRPVINVSWDDAQSYARWLSTKTGAFYRLPTEEEWEYAARAGAATAFSFGAVVKPNQANFDATHPYGGEAGEARNKTAPVGSYAKNAYGLYDMHGNVWEWVEDCWSATHADAPADGAARVGACDSRVLKGGAWNTGGWRLRAGHRIAKQEGAREYDNGFRVVKELP